MVSNQSPQPESDPEISRRAALFITGGMLAGLGTGLGLLVWHVKQGEEKFRELLRENPLSGEIAYAVGNQIKILPARNITESVAPTEIFQVERPVTNLAWLDENQLIYASKVAASNPAGTPDAGRRFEFAVVSDGLFKLDRKSGESVQLFNPYSDAAKALLGDIQVKDAAEESRLEEMMNTKERGIWIVYGDRAACQIAEIKNDPENSKILIRLASGWYSVDYQGENFNRATRIPATMPSPTESKDKLFHLESSGGSVRLTDGHATGIEFERGSQSPAWLHK